MGPSPKRRMWWGIALANGAILLLAAVLLSARPPALPRIEGVFISEPKPLAPFRLLDQHNRIFSNADLMGQWHLVAYGFTTCPDICPTTLAELAALEQGLQQQGRDDLDILFYSVDHRRDTPAQLASYLPYFSQDFLGLTHRDDNANQHLGFEQGLGIAYRLVPAADPAASADDYEVSHGVNLLLLNPAGELQAVFQPVTGSSGNPRFNPQRLVRDYLAIRDYLG